jgi:tRNA (guanine37-N1)-methyltransferase
MFDSYFKESILSRALKDKKVACAFYNPRDFANDKSGKVDGRPYGGGPGMVLQALPFVKAVEAARKKIKKGEKSKTIILSPGGAVFTGVKARSFARLRHIILVAGRYEGIDARVKKILHAEELSVGPYVLTGGELPAMTVIDAVTRHTEGVLGCADSIEEKRAASHEVYTRPEILPYKSKKYRVPAVLLSGDHGRVAAWRRKRGG